MTLAMVTSQSQTQGQDIFQPQESPVLEVTAVEPERTNRSYHKAHYDTFTIVIRMLRSTCGYITEFWWIQYVYFTPEGIIPSYPVIRYQVSLKTRYSGHLYSSLMRILDMVDP